MMKSIGVLAAVVLLAAGCGEDVAVEGRPPVYPTTVTVLHNGEPVEEATVTLRPEEGDAAAYGKTDADGAVQLTTFNPGDGAVAGEHEVRVRKVEVETTPAPTPSNPDGYKIVGETRLVPERYEKFETSGLTVTVDPEGENAATLELTD